MLVLGFELIYLVQMSLKVKERIQLHGFCQKDEN